jgi:sorting nexin-29
MIKYASNDVKIRFLNPLNNCWQSKYIPENWKEVQIIPIFGKGDRLKCENYRGISLLNEGYKIYAKIITARLQKIIKAIMLEEQSGFRKGRLCADNIFILKQLIEKRREFNHELNLLSIDYVKAFDRVDREKLWNILYKRYPTSFDSGN